jgi:hypothetical protein
VTALLFLSFQNFCAILLEFRDRKVVGRKGLHNKERDNRVPEITNETKALPDLFDDEYIYAFVLSMLTRAQTFTTFGTS